MTASKTGTPSGLLPEDGGEPARRAVARWGWRLFKREWRSQLLVLSLIAVAVAASVAGAAAAFNLGSAAGDAEFGSATIALDFDQPDPALVGEDIAAAAAWFGSVDVIGRTLVAIPGVFEPVELRSQDPEGPYSEPMVGLVNGRYPTSPGEITMTDETARLLAVDVGDVLSLGGASWNVVGMVENPSDLSDEFTLVSVDDAPPFDALTLLVEDSSEDRFNSFSAANGVSPVVRNRPGNEDIVAALGALTAGAVVLFLVSLVAAAGFAVVAQRRLRQLGMLAAVGATRHHIRLVLAINGFLIGVSGSALGAVIGLTGWIFLVPRLEVAVGHRIAPFDVPWWLVGAAMLLAVVMATASAWLPAKTIAHTPIVSALSGRPAPPQPASRSAARGLPLVVLGLGCLLLSGDSLNWLDVILVVGGTVSLMLGVLLISPLTIGVLTNVARKAPIPVRLALRDLVRYRSRSGAALAAISLALGVAAVIVITTSAALYASSEEGNLAPNHLLIRVGEIPSPGDVAPIEERSDDEVASLDALVEDLALSLGGRVTPIDVVVAPEVDLPGVPGLTSVVLTSRIDENTFRILTHLYVASPDLLDLYQLDNERIPASTDFLTVEEGELWLQPVPDELVRDFYPLPPSFTSLPGSMMTPEAMADRGWEATRAGWLIDAAQPLTTSDFDRARDMAAASGVTVEARNNQADLATLRWVATAAGVLVALGILGATVGLIRAEAAGDLRLLAATGASKRIRRSLTAASAGGLAALGAFTGLVGAYLGLAAAHSESLDDLSPIPLGHLTVLAIGLPLVAAGAGWLFAGQEPSALARDIGS
ncbi:MAG: FtsX-like permease family protein [Acidimicrobiia bacterium]